MIVQQCSHLIDIINVITGGKTDANAHPHVDQKGRVALVHNGTIENSDALKKELIGKGVVFKSQVCRHIRR